MTSEGGLLGVKVDEAVHTVLQTHAGPVYCSAGLGSGGLQAVGLAMQLAQPGASVLDGAAFVRAAAQLPAAPLIAALCNALLDATHQQDTNPSNGSSNAGGSGGGSKATTQPQRPQRGLAALLHPAFAGLRPLFPGAPSLQQLAAAACAAPERLTVFSPAMVELFSLTAHLNLYYGQSDFPRLPLRAAAWRGHTLLAVTDQQHAWCRFEFEGGSDPSSARQLRQSACSCGLADYGVLWCRHRQDAADALCAASGRGCDGANGTIGCASSSSDSGPQKLHVLDLDALEGMLSTLPPATLAQLLLQVALVTHSVPAVLEALALPGAPAAFFLPHLGGGLPLGLPSSEPFEGMTPEALGGRQGSPYRREYGVTVGRLQELRAIAAAAGDPVAFGNMEQLAEAYDVRLPKREDAAEQGSGSSGGSGKGALAESCFSRFGARRGCIADAAVAAGLRPVAAAEVCHSNRTGVDPENGLPWPHTHPSAYISPSMAPVGHPEGCGARLAIPMVHLLLQAGYASMALRLLQGVTEALSLPVMWRRETQTLAMEGNIIEGLRLAWESCTTQQERTHLFLGKQGGAVDGEQGPPPLALSAVWTGGFSFMAASLLGPMLGLQVIQRQMRCHTDWAASALAHQAYLGVQHMPTTNWLQHLNSCDAEAMSQLTAGCVPVWTAWLKQLRGEGGRAREGTLLRLMARQIAASLLEDEPQQAHARYAALILDLQEVVAAEAANLLQERLDSLTTLPWLVDEILLEVVPAHYARTAYKSCLKEYLVGVTEMGVGLNTGVLPPQELPEELAPHSQVAPFEWVRLRVREMLLSRNPRHQMWACTHLRLALQSQAGLSLTRTWRWMSSSADFMGWVAEAALDERTSAGARCALLKVLSLFTRSARNAHLYPHGLGADRELGLPSLGFVQEAEALCPQLVEATIAKAEQLLQAREERGALLSYSPTLRFCINSLVSLMTLDDDLRYFRAQLAAEAAMRDYPAAQQPNAAEPAQAPAGQGAGQGAAEPAANGAAANGIAANGTAANATAGSEAREGQPAEPAPLAEEAGPVSQCRKLLAWLASPSDPVELPGVEEMLERRPAGADDMQQQQQEQVQKQQGQQQEGQQRNSGASSSEVLQASEAAALLPAVPPAAPLSAEEAAALCRRLERLVPRHSPTSGALVKLLRSNQGGRPAAARGAHLGSEIFKASDVTDLALLRARSFCDGLEGGCGTAGQRRGLDHVLLLRISGLFLRLVLESYKEAEVVLERDLSWAQPVLAYVSRSKTSSTLWSTQELRAQTGDSPLAYLPSDSGYVSRSLKPPPLLSEGLRALATLLAPVRVRSVERCQSGAGVPQQELEQPGRPSGESSSGGQRSEAAEGAAGAAAGGRAARAGKRAASDGSGGSDGSAAKGDGPGEEQHQLLLGMLPMLCQLATALHEHVDSNDIGGVVYPATELVISLLHQAAALPTAAQQLACPGVLRFLTSPLVDKASSTAEQRMSESVAPTVAQLLPLLIFEAGPRVLLPCPSPSGQAAGGTNLGAAAGKEGEGSAQSEQRAAKRARSCVGNAPAGTSSAAGQAAASSSAAAAASAGGAAAAGSHQRQQQQQQQQALQGGASGQAAGTAAAGLTPQLLLQCLAWCQKWVTAAVSKYEAARVHAFPTDFTGLRKGISTAVDALRWWIDSGLPHRMPSVSHTKPDDPQSLQRLSAATVASTLLRLVPGRPFGLELEGVQLAACQALESLVGQGGGEVISRSPNISMLYRCLSTEGPASPLAPSPALREAAQRLEQALRSQLLSKSPGWAAVLDAHKRQADKLATPPADNPYVRMMQQERRELPPPLGVTAAAELYGHLVAAAHDEEDDEDESGSEEEDDPEFDMDDDEDGMAGWLEDHAAMVADMFPPHFGPGGGFWPP